MDNKTIKSTLDDIALDVGGTLELIRAVLSLYESHAAAYRERGLPSDLTGEFVSLTVRLLSDIEGNVKQLEDLAERMSA